MICPLLSEQTADVLLDYSAGRLDGARIAMVEEHMRSCAPCAAFSVEQTGVWTALDRWQPHPVNEGFNRRLWQKIDEAAAAPWHRRFADALRFGAWKPAFPLAATAVVIAAGFMFDHQSAAPARPAGTEVSGVSITDVDQVEKTLDDMQLLRQFDAAASSRPM